MKLKQAIIIARPVESVFAYRCALEKSAEWQPGVISAALDTHDPIDVGSRWRELRRGRDGVTQEWELEVTEIEQDHLLSIVGRFGSIRVDERHEFTRDDSNTRYTLHMEVTGSPLPAGAIQRKTVEALMHLKWALEGPQQAERRHPPRSAAPPATAVASRT